MLNVSGGKPGAEINNIRRPWGRYSGVTRMGNVPSVWCIGLTRDETPSPVAFFLDLLRPPTPRRGSCASSHRVPLLFSLPSNSTRRPLSQTALVSPPRDRHDRPVPKGQSGSAIVSQRGIPRLFDTPDHKSPNHAEYPTYIRRLVVLYRSVPSIPRNVEIFRG